MKGIMFNLLEDVLVEAYGAEAWDDLLTATGASGVYAALGDYPDADFFKLIETSGNFTQRSRDEMLIAFGEAAFARMAERYPAILDGVADTRTFLLALNRIVQAEVRKLYAGAGCPHFRFAIAPDRLRIGYSSPRKLCALAQGLIQGVALYFDEEIEVTHSECAHRGDAACRMDVVWPQ